MKCPACSCALKEIEAIGLLLDVCNEGCGGVWFDAKELEKVDELHEQIGFDVLRPVSNQNVVIDRNKDRICPRCSDTVMGKELYDSQFQIEIDACPSCSGIWLDLGELETLRSHNTSHQQRQETIERYDSLAKTADESVRNRLKAVCKLLF